MELLVSDHRRAGVALKSGVAFDLSSAAWRRNGARGSRSASLQRGGYRRPSASDAGVGKFRSVPLAIAAAGVLVVCLASIALSITGIIGRIPGLPGGSGGSTATAVHATPAINDQAVAPVATANQARPADRDIQHDPLTDR